MSNEFVRWAYFRFRSLFTRDHIPLDQECQQLVNITHVCVYSKVSVQSCSLYLYCYTGAQGWVCLCVSIICSMCVHEFIYTGSNFMKAAFGCCHTVWTMSTVGRLCQKEQASSGAVYMYRTAQSVILFSRLFTPYQLVWRCDMFPRSFLPMRMYYCRH